MAQATRSVLIDEQKICEVDKKLKELLNALEARSSKIGDWNTQTKLFIRFTAVIDELKQIPSFSQKDRVRDILNEVG